MNVALAQTESTRLVALLKGARFPVQDEDELQRAVGALLDSAGVSYQREVRLSARERVDFLVGGGIALELKVRTDPKALFAQMLRYAEHARITELVAASTTHHALRLPTTANGKPLHGVQLMRW